MKAILMLDEMPKGCVDCPLFNGDEFYCTYTKNDLNNWWETDRIYYRLEDCPLIEINDNIAKLVEVAR